MQRFSYVRALWMAAYSKELYRDVASQWRGLGLRYLLLLLAVSWAIELTRIHIHASAELATYGDKVAEQLPDITIRNGRATVEPPGKHFIHNPEDTSLVAIIDTTGETLSLEGTGAALLVTETKLHLYQPKRGETRIFELSRYEPIFDRVNPEILRGWVSFLRRWMGFILFGLCVPFSFLYRLIQIAFYSLLALPFAKAGKPTLDFASLMRISAVAITVPVAMETARSMLGWEIPVWWLICFVTATCYIHFGILASAQKQVAPAEGLAPPLDS